MNHKNIGGLGLKGFFLNLTVKVELLKQLTLSFTKIRNHYSGKYIINNYIVAVI